MRKERKKTQKDINKIINKLEERKLDEKLKVLEQMKDDSNKARQVVRELNNLRPKSHCSLKARIRKLEMSQNS